MRNIGNIDFIGIGLDICCLRHRQREGNSGFHLFPSFVTVLFLRPLQVFSFSLPSFQIRSDLNCNRVCFDSVIIIANFVEHSWNCQIFFNINKIPIYRLWNGCHFTIWVLILCCRILQRRLSLVFLMYLGIS